jgi:hypothetical protein
LAAIKLDGIDAVAHLHWRANDEIGDDAFRRVEQELDWLEMALGADVRQG